MAFTAIVLRAAARREGHISAAYFQALAIAGSRHMCARIIGYDAALRATAGQQRPKPYFAACLR